MPSDAPQYRIGNVGPGATVLQGEHLSVGFTAAQVQQLVQAERAGLVQQYTSQLIELSKQLGATQEAVRTMLRVAGQDDVPAERWLDTLVAIATQFHAMRQALERSTDDHRELSCLQGIFDSAHQHPTEPGSIALTDIRLLFWHSIPRGSGQSSSSGATHDQP